MEPKTPTIDPTKAPEPKLRAWLAELPCPECGGTGKLIVGGRGGGGHMNPHGEVLCTKCQDADGKPTGLALPWASESCLKCRGKGNRRGQASSTVQCVPCNGSGRVLKALTSDDLWEHGVHSVTHLGGKNGYRAVMCHASQGAQHGYGETPTLAALRAQVAQAQARLDG
ncbi:hypothetical protein LCGC14_0457880 [marine sediment metagenome]|uniref:CR-type domain-containing protein n=1 Tax=marine sediment metagenome TaxID=412755 RepID=A0A0F9SFT1_9ZZZZ